MKCRIPKEPWMLRACSERHRGWLTGLVAWLGAFSYFLLLMTGAVGVMVAPAVFAIWRPHAPVSRLLLWLMSRFGDGDTAFGVAFIVYMLVMFGVVWVLLSGIRVYDYLQFKGRLTQLDDEAIP